MARVLARGVVVLGLCALAACSGKSEAKSARPATPPTTVAPTTTTDPRVTPVDQVPAVITVEYVQRVMDALDRVEGDLTRKLYRDKVPTLEWRQGLMAIFDGKAFDLEEADFGRDAARSFDTYRDPPGDPKTVVKRVFDASATCVVAGADRDFGPFFVRPPSSDELQAVVVLQPKNATRDATGRNPTAWAITADGKPAPNAALEHGCH